MRIYEATMCESGDAIGIVADVTTCRGRGTFFADTMTRLVLTSAHAKGCESREQNLKECNW